MKKMILSVFTSACSVTGALYGYVDCAPPSAFDYRQGLDDYQRREQERLDRLPQKHEIHPDGRGGYYYYN